MNPSLAYLDSFFPSLPCNYPIEDFQLALQTSGFARIKQKSFGLPSWMEYNAERVLGRIVRNVCEGLGPQLLCLLMGPAAHRLVPDGILNRCSIYCWDTWPENFARWDSLFERFRTPIAFFSSRQAKERFESCSPDIRCYWVPEATDPTIYDSNKPLSRRTINVLELGRRYNAFHQEITPVLASARISHLYESSPGRVIFDTREGLIQGLADSKILISFPASVTTPSRAAIETVTHRYFQGMASGCLLVGRCPSELQDLIGYNPVIEVDFSNASEQILNVLQSIEAYQDFVNQNLETVRHEGCWKERVAFIKSVLVGSTIGA